MLKVEIEERSKVIVEISRERCQDNSLFGKEITL
jgi:hypothetical protein